MHGEIKKKKNTIMETMRSNPFHLVEMGLKWWLKSSRCPPIGWQCTRGGAEDDVWNRSLSGRCFCWAGGEFLLCFLCSISLSFPIALLLVCWGWVNNRLCGADSSTAEAAPLSLPYRSPASASLLSWAVIEGCNKELMGWSAGFRDGGGSYPASQSSEGKVVSGAWWMRLLVVDG